ncbi:protein CLEC16A [Sarotherodon galilaeus]
MTPYLLHPPPSSCMLPVTMLGFLMLIFSLCDALELKTKNSTHVMSSSEGTNIMLTCEAVGNPPPVYNWTCDGENMLENTNSLNITLVKRNTTCTCTAASYLGNITKTFHVHAEPRGCPLTLTASEIVVKFGDPISINCSTSATDVEGMGWEAPFGGTGFERPPVVTWRVDQVEEWTPSPSCYATLVDGSQCTVSPLITVYKTPDFVSLSDLDHGPMVEGREYDLKCYVISVGPVQNLTVTWYRGNESVQTETLNHFNMTPVNTSSTLRISPKRDYNGLTFRCEAELHLGPKGPQFLPNISSPPYTAVVFYAPEFKKENESKEVLQGEDVTLSCSADSNPPSNITWIYTAAVNSNVTTEGQQKTITITGVTSANAGIYICVAENEAGRNTRFVSLVIKDKVPLLVIGVLLAVFAIGLIVLLVFIYYRKRKNRHFFLDTVSNATDVPLTPASSNA